MNSKRIISILIVICMFLTLTACNITPTNNIPGVTSAELNSAWGKEFKYKYYYGEINEFKVFMVSDDEETDNNFKINGLEFKYHSSFNIYLYKDNSFVSLKDAFNNNYINEENVIQIYNMHCEKTNQDNLDVRKDYFGNEIPQAIKLNDKELEGSVYYGDFEGYSVYFIPSEWTAEEKFILGDVVFFYSYLFDIKLVKDEEFISIEEAYLKSLVSDETIRNIGYYHAEYVKSEFIHGYESEEEFYQRYYNIECTGKIYNKSGIVDLYDNNISLPYTLTIQNNGCIQDIETILGSEFNYELYCGKMNDYYLFVVNDEKYQSTYQVNDDYFIHDTNFTIYAYKNNVIYDFFELCAQDEFSQTQISVFSYVFKLMQRYNTFKKLNDVEFNNVYKINN